MTDLQSLLGEKPYLYINRCTTL